MQCLKNVRDDVLLGELSRLVRQSRGVEAEIVAHIAEVERRRLYAREACSSMFEYCRRLLGLRENEAYLRITVARAAREHPVILEMLDDGRLHLSGIARLAPHLTRKNAVAVLDRASGMSHREIRELVAELEPRPDVVASIRKLREPSSLHSRDAFSAALPAALPGASPVASPADSCAGSSAGSPADSFAGWPVTSQATFPGASPAPSPDASPIAAAAQLGAPRVESDPVNPELKVAPARPVFVEPLAPARYQVRFTASVELRDKLERLQALMRASVPDGDLARIIEIAVSEKLERVESRRFGQTKEPRREAAQSDTSAASRHIPAAVRRLVYARDGGRCTYGGLNGIRCASCDGVEYHHRRPFGRGGDHHPDNLTLLCRAHNLLLAEQDYGEEVMGAFRSSKARDRQTGAPRMRNAGVASSGPWAPRRTRDGQARMGARATCDGQARLTDDGTS